MQFPVSMFLHFSTVWMWSYRLGAAVLLRYSFLLDQEFLLFIIQLTHRSYCYFCVFLLSKPTSFVWIWLWNVIKFNNINPFSVKKCSNIESVYAKTGIAMPEKGNAEATACDACPSLSTAELRVTSWFLFYLLRLRVFILCPLMDVKHTPLILLQIIVGHHSCHKQRRIILQPKWTGLCPCEILWITT